LLVDLKNRDPKVREQAERVRTRRRHAETAMANRPEPDLADDGVLAGELRREKALTAASGVPSRPGKAAPRRSAGGSSRPTGKRRR
jgi:preprotein translocase subunit SecF